MKIYNEVIIDMNPESSTYGEHLSEDSYEYNGDMALCYGYEHNFPSLVWSSPAKQEKRISDFMGSWTEGTDISGIGGGMQERMQEAGSSWRQFLDVQQQQRQQAEAGNVALQQAQQQADIASGIPSIEASRKMGDVTGVERSYGMGSAQSRGKAAGMFGDIGRQLTGLGLGQSAGLGLDPTRINRLSGGSIAGALASKFGITEKMPAGMFDPISRAQTKGLQWETYRPQLEQQQQSLAQGLISGYGSRAARQAGGGFAGSAAQKSYQTGVKDVFGRGMTGAIGNVAKQRAKAFGGIQETIAGWTQQAQKFKRGG